MNRVMLVKSTCIDEQEYVRQHVPFSIKEQWFEMVPIQTNYQIVSEVVNKIIINTVNTVNTVNTLKNKIEFDESKLIELTQEEEEEIMNTEGEFDELTLKIILDLF